MQKYCYISFALWFIFVSCSSLGKSPLEDFDNKYTAAHIKLNVNPEKITTYGRLLLFEDEEYLIKEEHETTLLSKIYYTGDSIVSIAKKGSGPGEYLWLSLMQKDSTGSIFAIDNIRMKAYRMTVDGERISEVQFNNPIFNVLPSHSNYVILGFHEGINGLKGTRYFLSDSIGNILYTFGNFPDDNNPASRPFKLMAYQGTMIYNQYKNRLAFFSLWGALFDIYELSEQVESIANRHYIFSQYYSDEDASKIGVEHKPDNLFGFMDAYATPDFIYALYSGNYLERKDNISYEKAISSRHILVYDWDGNPVCMIDTDIDLLNICVSSDNRELIAIYIDGDYGLCSFDLSKIPNLYPQRQGFPTKKGGTRQR
jgi:hypothetical protein